MLPGVYHYFVRRHLREVVRRLNAGDYEFVRRQFHPAAEHWFSGEHALSGRRTSASRIADWYARLGVVFPSLRFETDALFVSGPPWRTRAALEWTDEARDTRGAPMVNRGVFVLELRWGKAISFHVHCDTALLERNLGLLAEQGVREARLAPIEG